MTSIKVGTAPQTANVPLYYAAMPGGIFSKHNLSATPQEVASGATAIPLVLSQQIQFTASDALATMQAIKNKTPLVIVGQGNTSGVDAAHDNTGLVVKPNITSAADLAGKTIGVSALNGLANVTVKAAIDANGGDSSKVKFVEVPIPQMPAAVKSGTVDGAAVSEPFLAAAKQAQLKVLFPFFAAVSVKRVPLLVYVTSKSYLANHPDVVKAFADSIKEANEAVTADPSLIKTVGLRSTKTSAVTLNEIVLPVFDPPTVQIETLKQIQSLAVKYGNFGATFDPTPYVYTG